MQSRRRTARRRLENEVELDAIDEANVNARRGLDIMDFGRGPQTRFRSFR